MVGRGILIFSYGYIGVLQCCFCVSAFIAGLRWIWFCCDWLSPRLVDVFSSDPRYWQNDQRVRARQRLWTSGYCWAMRRLSLLDQSCCRFYVRIRVVHLDHASGNCPNDPDQDHTDIPWPSHSDRSNHKHIRNSLPLKDQTKPSTSLNSEQILANF